MEARPPAASGMETLSFPRFNAAELVGYIRNLILTGADGKNLSKTDLYPNPKPEVLHTIFMRALQIVYGIRLDHFYMMPMNVEIVYPQIMEGFLPICSLFIHLDSFLPICRVNDFEIADVLCPKGKRTSRFLSGIINFIHFRETHRETYLELLWRHKSSLDKKNQLEAANREAVTKLETLNSVPAEQRAEFQHLSDDIQKLQQTLNQDFRRKTGGLQEVISQKKAVVAEKTRRLNEIKLALVALREEQDSLKAKIVESPEELKNYKEKMKETVQKLKLAKQGLTEKYEAYRDLVDSLPACQLEVRSYQKKVQSLAANVDRAAAIRAESRALEDQIESGQVELKNLNTESSSLKRLTVAKKEKLTTAQFKITKNQEDAELYKRTVFEDCNKVQEKRGAVCERVTAINNEIQKVKLAIQNLHDTTKREKLKSQEIFSTLRSALEKYHDALEKTAQLSSARMDDKMAELNGKIFQM
ncbi:kinetochore protein Nuf2 [Ornithorhynchus anatinus]|uniref:Kinetochore protein NUF2 n=1 Tax=Ornithorhynchus anatinus TaxID=9258 RepID=A0A6I8NJ12_ORNAN|nr:kinetochore protein Nuf2 [Ornithorhynchus anatinus]